MTCVTALSIQPERSPRTLPGFGPLKTIGLMVLEILLKIAHVEAPQRVDFLVSSAGVRKGSFLIWPQQNCWDFRGPVVNECNGDVSTVRVRER
jgi:hypothetical protein